MFHSCPNPDVDQLPHCPSEATRPLIENKMMTVQMLLFTVLDGHAVQLLVTTVQLPQ